jgi:hypothetical protein
VRTRSHTPDVCFSKTEKNRERLVKMTKLENYKGLAGHSVLEPGGLRLLY